MRPTPLLLPFAVLFAGVAFCAHAAAPAAAPKSIGVFGDWQAATYEQGGHTVCYAFVRASTSGKVAGRDDPVLTVTERPALRDAVAISAAGYAAGQNMSVSVGSAQLAFYTAGGSAFARDGHAAVAAFQKGDTAVAKSPAGKGASMTDTFSLRGFTAAYGATAKACPAG